MLRTVLFFILTCGPRFNAFAAGLAAAEQAHRKEISKTNMLQERIQEALARGSPGRIPGPTAFLLGFPKDFPTSDLALSREQTDDKMNHLFKVTVEKLAGSKSPKQPGLELMTTYVWPGHFENYVFRVSSGGSLEKAGYIHGQVDEQGKGVKGSGATMNKDINSPEIKERFQHEMDLWLRKTYLKKEWRSAEFSAGILQNRNRVK